METYMKSLNKGDVMNEEDWKEKEAKLFAFWSVVIATIAVISAVITLPALYTSVQSLNTELAQESDFCKLQVRDFWIKMYSIGISANAYDSKWVKREARSTQASDRTKRHWLFGKWIGLSGTENQFDPNHSASPPGSESSGYGGDSEASPASSNAGYGEAPAASATPAAVDSNEYGIQVSLSQPPAPPVDAYVSTPTKKQKAYPPSISPQEAQKKPTIVVRPPIIAQPATCGCSCQYGPPGPSGESGDDGKDGSDGIPGKSGDDGRNGEIIITQRESLKEPCIICPVGHSGPPGSQGTRGPPGPRGSNGLQGTHGNQGEPGMQGPPGPIGAPGPMGNQGPTGPPGRQFMRDGARGPPGKPGPVGQKGIQGCQGTPGGTVVGPKGERGDPGRPGHDGHKGVQGPDGVTGAKGASGDCFLCPLPRTPPGY